MMVPKYSFRNEYEIGNCMQLCSRVANKELAKRPKCE